MSVGINAIAADDSQGSRVPKADNGQAGFTLLPFACAQKHRPKMVPRLDKPRLVRFPGRGRRHMGRALFSIANSGQMW